MAIVVHHAAIRTLEEDVRFRAVYEARTGCGVARHCVPNTIGVMFMNKHEEAPASPSSGGDRGVCVCDDPTAYRHSSLLRLSHVSQPSRLRTGTA